MVQLVELLRRDLFEWPVHCDTGVVHQHIESAQKRHRSRRQARQRRHFSKVRLECRRRSAAGHNLLDHSFGARGAVRVMHGHRRARACESERHAPPNSRAGAGHQDAFTAKISRIHVCSSRSHCAARVSRQE